MSIEFIHTALSFLFLAVWTVIGQIMVSDRYLSDR